MLFCFISNFCTRFYRTLDEDVYIISDVNSIELNFSKPGKYQVFEGFSPTNINWKSCYGIDGSSISLPRYLPRPCLCCNHTC